MRNASALDAGSRAAAGAGFNNLRRPTGRAKRVAASGRDALVSIRSFAFDPALSEAMIAFRFELHGADPTWIPPLRSELRSLYDPSFDFYRRPGNRHRHFVALAGGEVLGHVSAMINRDMRDGEDEPVGIIGLFECAERMGVAAGLFGSAVDWLRRQHGVRRIWGPINFDIWHGYRMMTRGFDQAPFFGEPRNPSHYPAVFDDNGFAVRQRWETVETPAPWGIEAIAAPLKDAHDACLRRGYHIDTLAAASPGDLRALHELETASFARFVGYTPLRYEEFARLYRGYAKVVDMRLVTLVRDDRDVAVGFSVAYPDLSGAVRAMGGRDTLPAKIGFLLRRRRASRIVYYMIGATPEASARRHGIGAAMVHHTLRRLLAAGYESVLFALIAADSPARRILGDAVRHAQREYALYELKL